MNIYYNKAGIGDVLIIDYLKEATEVESFDHGKGITKITDLEGEVVGYNLFNASQYFDLNDTGKIKTDQAFIQRLNDVFAEKGITDTDFIYDPLPDFVVGYVKEKQAHPDADKLSVCQVDIGEKQPLQIVCGAPNIEQDQKVVVARVGAVMPSGMIIKDAALRGVQSSGMICSARELGLPNAPTKKGILVLDETETVGKDFFASINH
ncbi:tRNA-binding protein [Pullulanibacillus pueri]|uniref:tRNA-binding protein n=1 Tax=Pullulanibacillus pueri TaxID=1437324 RepID=A0A8J3A203_9BACL|nr:DUF4479 domain-containing protein [Pullulanibacillus pueri]MBM7683976.1 tRNA-binding protein [Pullulanibacillus pueri]GGH88132.1 tRNA-binding protein [Pullulanibacillus pueri]